MCVPKGTREQVAKTACPGGTLTNTAGVTSATAMVTIVNLETAMRLYATVDHLSLDRIALVLVSQTVSKIFMSLILRLEKNSQFTFHLLEKYHWFAVERR